jgi:hypothetical protein
MNRACLIEWYDLRLWTTLGLLLMGGLKDKLGVAVPPQKLVSRLVATCTGGNLGSPPLGR